LQARGEHNPRHFDKHIWKLPIPVFDPKNDTHNRLAQAGAEAEAVCPDAFVAKRGQIRNH
jgi:hypothetical protein